jgi:hypothetical protein
VSATITANGLKLNFSLGFETLVGLIQLRSEMLGYRNAHLATPSKRIAGSLSNSFGK